MFPPFKPFRSLFADDPVQKVLEHTLLPGSHHSIASLISQSQRQNEVMTLTLRLPAGYDPRQDGDLQALHAQLADALAAHGVQELNINVVASQTASSAHGQSQSQTQSQNQTQSQPRPLPPVQDAARHDPRAEAQTLPAATAHEPAPPARSVPRQPDLPPHPHIQHIIVVASGKGGVGKSTTAVNLALALHKAGARVGVLDADIYGPSIPTMLGVAGQTPRIENDQFVPIEAHGLAMMSIGCLTGDDQTPIVWRGPKATGALLQLYNQTAWPMLDYLVIDLPPGTGDIQLTLAQRIPVSGAVIVTTPQHIALLDAQKGIEMFAKVDIPILGVVENMAMHVCSQCGHVDEIFGAGGGAQLEQHYRVPLLVRLPLDAAIGRHADAGQPSVVAGDAAAPLYQHMALQVIQRIAVLPQRERDARRIF